MHFWSTVSDRGVYTINTDLIEAVQGRCPRFSQRDHKHIQKLLESDGPLSNLSHQAREHIFYMTVQYTRTIPSLFTFFQDWKYIQICCEVLTGLLAVEDRPVRRGLKECFDPLFRQPQHMVVQINHDTFQTCSVQDRSDCFRLAYWQLWLCAMRLWPFLLVRRGRKRQNSVDERFITAHRAPHWSLIARNAQRLGFDSPHIQSLSAQSHSGALDNLPQYQGLTADVDSSSRDRYGTPFSDEYLSDRNSLFLPNLVLNSSVLEAIGIGEDVTTLLVRRSLFLRIFPDCQMPRLASTVASEHRPSTHQGQDGSGLSQPSAHDHFTPPDMDWTTQSNMGGATQSTDVPPATIGVYYVDVWNGERGLVSQTKGTKEQWIADLHGFIRHNFTLWDSDILVTVDPEGLEIYPKRRIMALPRGFDIDQLRRARGMAVQ